MSHYRKQLSTWRTLGQSWDCLIFRMGKVIYLCGEYVYDPVSQSHQNVNMSTVLDVFGIFGTDNKVSKLLITISSALGWMRKQALWRQSFFEVPDLWGLFANLVTWRQMWIFVLWISEVRTSFIGELGPFYLKYSITWLLMSWCKEPGHH